MQQVGVVGKFDWGEYVVLTLLSIITTKAGLTYTRKHTRNKCDVEVTITRVVSATIEFDSVSWWAEMCDVETNVSLEW